MGTLEVSFYGPFFYNLKANPVEVYAPKCPGHKAGIFSAKSEWPLHGRHQDGVDLKYSLGGSVFTPPAPVPPINIYDPQGIILDASASAKLLTAMLPAFESGALSAPPIDQVVPLDRAVDAYQRVAAGERERFVLAPEPAAR